jgi:hypothetical protein
MQSAHFRILFNLQKRVIVSVEMTAAKVLLLDAIRLNIQSDLHR